MGIIGRRKNRKYDYEPRFYKSSDGSKPFEIKHKFDEHRKTIGSNGLKTRFNNAIDDFKAGSDNAVKKRIYIIIGVLILFFLWLIGFDFTTFSFK